MAAQDLTNYIGRVWQDCARLDIGLMLYRVPSKSNIADGPTRYDLTTLEKFKAQFVPPVLPHGWRMFGKGWTSVAAIHAFEAGPRVQSESVISAAATFLSPTGEGA